jgi:phage terminase large subunit-like protein
LTTNGIMLCTFTPMKGLSNVVRHFLPDGKMPVEQLEVGLVTA